MRSFERENNAAAVVDDISLLTLVKDGDERSIGQLYDRYAKIVYSMALHALRDPASAEDVLQDIFLQVWRTPERFLALRGSLGAALILAARDASMQRLKRSQQPIIPADVTLIARADLTSEAQQTVLAGKARGILRSLPAEYRKTLEMAFYDGIPDTEIAEMTGYSAAVIKTRLRTALLTLRKEMQL